MVAIIPKFQPSRWRQLELMGTRYTRETTPAEIEAWQLDRFNEMWRFCLQNRAFYRQWQSVHGLPQQIASFAELQTFPVLTKGDLSTNEDLVFAESNRGRVYTTGGSTSEPTRFPRAKSENAQRWAGNYVGRRWWGIEPQDSRMLLWGHSHLYGTGIGSTFRKFQQQVKDSLTHTVRVNGYLTDPAAYIRYLEVLLRNPPTHIVGYASALTRLAYAVDDEMRGRIASLQLKGIIATSDSLSAPDETLIREAFSCPVIIEYGAAETGILAISRHSPHQMQVLWDQCILLSEPTFGALYTSLSPRQFPLVNYALGDQVVSCEATASGSLIMLSKVQGRSSDLVSLRTKTEAGKHLELWCVQLTHIIKSFGGIRAVQFQQNPAQRLTFFVDVLPAVKRAELVAFVERTLEREFSSLDLTAISWDFETPHEKSLSGKHLVLRS